MKSFKTFFENISNSSELKSKIMNSKFFKEIRYTGGRIYFVGGAVRDLHLNIESKDIDLIVSNIPNDRLEEILKKHGQVNKVGDSFGVLKFIPNEFKVVEPIDIALPRTERPMTQEEKESYKKKYKKYPSSYQAFTVEPDHELHIEKDLLRRDFTINAIAQDHLGNNIDPYNGLRDIKNKVIRMVSPKNFSEDPLRMLRGVQFASRFGFKIESKTFDTIRRNASLISSIPGERILEEIKKIVFKGNHFLGAKLLCETNLWQEISRIPCKDYATESHLFSLSNKSKTVSEFLFLMVFGVAGEDTALSLAQRLKCEIIMEKQIKGLYYAWESDANPHMIVYNLNRIHPTCLNLLVLPEKIKESISSNMPKSIKELDFNGKDLMDLGYKEEGISKAFVSILNRIFNGEINNSKEEILNSMIKNPS